MEKRSDFYNSVGDKCSYTELSELSPLSGGRAKQFKVNVCLNPPLALDHMKSFESSKCQCFCRNFQEDMG